MEIPTHKIKEDQLYIKWRDIKMVPGAIENAHRHTYFQFMFFEEVGGTHEIDFNAYESSSESLHFVGKGRVHKVAFENELIGGVFVFPEALFGMSDADMKLLHSLTYFKNEAHPILQLLPEEFLLIKQLVTSLKQSLENSPLEVSKYMLFALLASVREIYNAKEKMDVNSSTLKLSSELILFKQLVRKHANEWNTVELFVKELHISAARLNQLCKKQYGKTALQLLHERKLLAAKRMLVYTEKQVKEVAYDCGFADVAYFNRFFKKHVHCTPIEFRNNH